MGSWLTFEVPGKPQGARRHRVSKRGTFAHMHHSDEHLAAEDRIARIAHAADVDGVVRTMPLRLVIKTYHRRPQSMAKARKHWNTPEAPFVGKPDADNVAKLVMDALTQARCWADDTVVAQLEVRRWWVAVDEHGVQGPERTVVRVEAL